MIRRGMACLIAVVAACGIALAHDLTGSEIVSVEAGFGGKVKIGYWAPFTIQVRSSESGVGRVELIVFDGDATPSRVTAPVQLAAGAPTRVSMYAKVGQLKRDIVVNLYADDRLLASRRLTPSDDGPLRLLPSTHELILTLGSPFSNEERTQWEQRNASVVICDDIQSLPDDWWGYDGLDAVIIATSDPAISNQFPASDRKMSALARWVSLGGRVIVSAARNAESILATGQPLARLVPGTFERMLPLGRQTIAIEAYAETNDQLPPGGPAIDVPKLSQTRGKIEAFAGNRPKDLPLVVRAPHGFGELVFAAFDLNQPPLVGWAGRERLFDRLLARPRTVRGASDAGPTGQVTTLGFADLAGQLRAALNQFDGVPLIPFWFVTLLIVAYILCIGPLDYWLVTRVLKRMESTWITFAVWVALFGIGALALAYQLKGDALRANQIDVVDFDAESKLIRGTAWTDLFSPQAAAYDLTLQLNEKSQTADGPPQLLFSWLGLPGSGLGGLTNANRGILPFTEPYDYVDDLSRLQHVPIASWSSKAFVGRWWAEATAPIEADLTDSGKLTGRLVSRLEKPLTDGVLIYGRWAYPLKQFKPRQSLDVETQLDAQTVETYLRHVRLERDQSQSAPYDREGFDASRILEIMSAHELAGGDNYTRLSNRYQGWLELSGLVRSGRAILLGRYDEQAAQPLLDGKPLDDPRGRHETFYRFVFPVKEPLDAR